jgi:hypothetical protein
MSPIGAPVEMHSSRLASRWMLGSAGAASAPVRLWEVLVPDDSLPTVTIRAQFGAGLTAHGPHTPVGRAAQVVESPMIQSALPPPIGGHARGIVLVRNAIASAITQPMSVQPRKRLRTATLPRLRTRRENATMVGRSRERG